MAYDLSRLVNVQVVADGWQAQCPVCASQQHDLKGKNHLRLYRSGAFSCVLHRNDPDHNRAIKSVLMGYGLNPDEDYIVQQPRLTVDKIYPDSVLSKVTPNHAYWIKRGMRESVLNSLECGLAPQDEKGPLTGRSIFPLRNPEGRIAAFTGRLVIDNSIAARWKHIGAVSKVVWPWRVSGSEIERTKTAILVESPGDTISLLCSDIKPVICLFGLNLFDLTVSHLIASGVNKVFVSLNRDADARKGQAAAARIAKRLEPFVGEVVVRLPSAPFKDWGACREAGEAGTAELTAFKREIES